MRLRIPLWTLMSAIFLVAIGFAALRHPTELVASAVFTLAVGLLGVAVVVAVATRGRKRLAWLSFAVSSAIYLGFTFGPFFLSNGVRPPPFLPTTLMTTGLRYLDSNLTPTSSAYSTVSPLPTVSFNNGPASSVSYTISPTQPGTFVIDPSANVQPATTFTDYLSFNYQNSFATGVPNREPFYQVGHSLATLLVGFIAAVITLVVTAFRRGEVP